MHGMKAVSVELNRFLRTFSGHPVMPAFLQIEANGAGGEHFIDEAS